MASFGNAVLLIHAAATLLMVGLIWFVQIVHYPLFAQVGRDEFEKYEQHHQRLTTWVVAPPMLLELLTAVLLVWGDFPALGSAVRWTGLTLVVLIWLTTVFVQIPQHKALAAAWDEKVQRRLVAGNWIRTIAWSIRSLLVLWMIQETISSK